MRRPSVIRQTVQLALLLPVLFWAAAVDAGSWSRWLRSDCYGSIEYRVRYLRAAGEDRHQWAVDIRNRYRETAHFYWVVAGVDEEKPRLNNQMALRAGGRLRRNSMTTAGPGDRVKLLAAHLRLGRKDVAERACDADARNPK